MSVQRLSVLFHNYHIPFSQIILMLILFSCRSLDITFVFTDLCPLATIICFLSISNSLIHLAIFPPNVLCVLLVLQYNFMWLVDSFSKWYTAMCLTYCRVAIYWKGDRLLSPSLIPQYWTPSNYPIYSPILLLLI